MKNRTLGTVLIRTAVAIAILLAMVALPRIAVADTVAVPEIGESETFDAGWNLRVYVAGIDFDSGSERLNRPAGPRGYDIEAGGGVGVNAEYRFSRRLGVDLGVLAGAGVDIEVWNAGTGHSGPVTYDTVTFTPLTAGLDVHLTPDHRADLYFCPLAALVFYSGLDVRVGGGATTAGVHLDEDFALGAALGVGVPFGDRPWSFQANVMYLDTEINGTGVGGVPLASTHDATTFGFGFGYRF